MDILLENNFPIVSAWADIINRTNTTLDTIAGSVSAILQQVTIIAHDLSVRNTKLDKTDTFAYTGKSTLNIDNIHNEQGFPIARYRDNLMPRMYDDMTATDRSIDIKEKAETGVKIYKDASEAVDKSFDLAEKLGTKFGRFEHIAGKLKKGVGVFSTAMTIIDSAEETGILSDGTKKVVDTIGTSVSLGLTAAEIFSNPVGWAVGLGALAVSLLNSESPAKKSDLPSNKASASERAIDSFYNADKETYTSHLIRERESWYSKDINKSEKDLYNYYINKQQQYRADNTAQRPIIAEALMGEADKNAIWGALAGTLDIDKAVRSKNIAGQEGDFLLDILGKELHRVGEVNGANAFYTIAERAEVLSDTLSSKGANVKQKVLNIINTEKNKLAKEARQRRGRQSMQSYSKPFQETSSGRIINININKSMVEHFTINAKEVKEGYTQLERMVEESLLRILNSANAAA